SAEPLHAATASTPHTATDATRARRTPFPNIDRTNSSSSRSDRPRSSTLTPDHGTLPRGNQGVGYPQGGAAFRLAALAHRRGAARFVSLRSLNDRRGVSSRFARSTTGGVGAFRLGRLRRPRSTAGGIRRVRGGGGADRPPVRLVGSGVGAPRECVGG